MARQALARRGCLFLACLRKPGLIKIRWHNFSVFLNLSQHNTMKNKFTGFAIFLAGLLAGSIIIVAIFGFEEIRNTKKPVEKTAAKNYNWTAPPLPASIDFAGENTPLERWEVKEQLDREVLLNYYWQNNILYMM